MRLADADYQAEMRGERLLRSDACPFCKSCLGHLLTDQSELYQLIDGLVSVNTCDMMRRLPEVVEKIAPYRYSISTSLAPPNRFRSELNRLKKNFPTSAPNSWRSPATPEMKKNCWPR